MEYPATQMFVDNDAEDEEEEEETEKDAGTPLRTEKNIKIGVLFVDSSTYPVHRGINRVGRIESCSIVIDHNTISKEHAEIEAGLGSKSTFISDLGSLNKTKLNDAILRPGRLYQLQDGDVVRFGSVNAVFKVEGNKPEEPSARSSDCGGFIIPDTPGPSVHKNVHPVIPGTPDTSFNGSLTDGNRSGDVSVVVGTQEAKNIRGRTSSRLSREPLSPKESVNGLNLDPDEDRTRQIGNGQDISDLETQKNISIENSDEEDIFEMMTQRSDIHDDETQKFSKDNTLPRSNVSKTESYSHSIEDLETQKFPNDHNETESCSKSINDLETQKFSVPNVDHGSRQSVNKNDSPSESIDVTEPRFGEINDLETQKFRNDVPRPRYDPICDLETQKIPIDGEIRSSCHDSDITESPHEAMNDLQTQKVPIDDDQDSETDEEGIFAEDLTGNEIIDVFDAPTQLIRAPREASQSPCKILDNQGDVVVEKNEPGVPIEQEITRCHALDLEEKEEQIHKVLSTNVSEVQRDLDSVIVKSPCADVVKINEEKKSTLNDSIESKLNHMFDEVNESAVDEPTQILTQHLENILESTQIYRSEHHHGSEGNTHSENASIHLPKITNRDDANIHCPCSAADDDDDDTAKSDDGNMNKYVKGLPTDPIDTVSQIPKILSTQELFEGLPAVNFFRTPSRNSGRGKIKVSPPSGLVSTPRSRISTKFEPDNSEAVGDTETSNLQTDCNTVKKKERRPKKVVESVNAKRSQTTENVESRTDTSRFTPIMDIQVLPKIDGRRKPRTQKKSVVSASSARNLEEANAKIEAPMKAESRKKLPLKKRGSPFASDPPTPRKVEVEVVSSARIKTRSSEKISIEKEKKLTRLSAVDNPRVSVPEHAPSSSVRVNQDKYKTSMQVLPAKTEPSHSHRKVTSSKIADDTLSTINSNLEGEIKHQQISSPRRGARRAPKKPLDTSDSITDVEATSPIKRPKMSSSTLPSTVNNRPRYASLREKQKKVSSLELNVPESSDLTINQNNSSTTRSRRGRAPVNMSSTDSSRNSSLAIESLDNTAQQPSLESQEIQAILGIADQGVYKVSHSLRGRRKFQNHDSSNDSKKGGEDLAITRPGFKGFVKNLELKQDVENKFEKPVGRPGRTKRQLRQTPQLDSRENNDDKNDEHLTETNKNRPNSRGKKNPDVSQNDLRRDESADDASIAVAALGSSNVKSDRKLTKKDKMETEKMNQNSPPAPVIIAKESTRKRTPVRNKREVSQRVTDLEENGVEEPPAKRGRPRNVGVNKREKSSSTDDDMKGSQESYSPLRRGRSSLATPTSSASSSTKTKHKILFTGLNDSQLVSIVHNLGGNVTEKPNDCTALVTDKIRRTYKFLCAMAMAVPIVSVEWLKESEKKGGFLETGDFLLKDPVEEAKFKFNLRRSLVMATDDKLLEGYTVVLTPNTAPPPVAEMKSIIQACGGKPLARPPTNWPEKSLIISRQEDMKNAKKFLTKAPKSVHLLSVEFILTGILRHELNFREHKLEID